MILEMWIFTGIGILSSWIVFTDKIFSDVCMTKGCDIIRKTKMPKLHGWFNFLVYVVGYMGLLWLYIWFPSSEIIGAITFTGTIYSVYMLTLSIIKFKTICKFQLAYYMSMIVLFLLWLAEYLSA